MIDVVCYYVDFGRPYQPLMERMCASAKRVMDCRTVIMTPTPRPWMDDVFDHVAPHTSVTEQKVTLDNLCQQRSEAMMSWAALTRRDTLFVDPDLEFIAPPPFDDSFDVGLLWQRDRMTMPVNTGAILCRPGQREFWLMYGNSVVNLPGRIHGWWCDQLGFSLMLGTQHAPGDRLVSCGARVWLMDGPDHCDTPKRITPNAWAKHYKGRLKGEGWAKIFQDDVFSKDLFPEFVNLRSSRFAA